MGENKEDHVLKELAFGVDKKHVGKVAGILKNMTVEEADDIVLVLKDMFADVMKGEEGTENFLRKVIAQGPLDPAQLAKAVLACLRKDPVESTYELANQLIVLSGVPLDQLAYQLKGLVENSKYDCPQEVLDRFWNDTMKGTSQPIPIH